MRYIVLPKLNGYSYVDVPFTFNDRNEALDFAELMFMSADADTIKEISIQLVREEAEA